MGISPDLISQVARSAALMEPDDAEAVVTTACEVAVQAAMLPDAVTRERYFRRAHAEQLARYLVTGLSPAEADRRADRLLMLTRLVMDHINVELARQIQQTLSN